MKQRVSFTNRALFYTLTVVAQKEFYIIII